MSKIETGIKSYNVSDIELSKINFDDDKRNVMIGHQMNIITALEYALELENKIKKYFELEYKSKTDFYYSNKRDVLEIKLKEMVGIL